jgi:hypothetical protein
MAIAREVGACLQKSALSCILHISFMLPLRSLMLFGQSLDVEMFITALADRASLQTWHVKDC